MTATITTINEKHEAFQRLADSRTNRVLKQLKLISNLSNRSTYDYNEHEVAAMLEAIEMGVIALRASFARKLNTPMFSVANSKVRV